MLLVGYRRFWTNYRAHLRDSNSLCYVTYVVKFYFLRFVDNWYVWCFPGDCLYQLLYIHGMARDDGLQICPKHVEID